MKPRPEGLGYSHPILTKARYGAAAQTLQLFNPSTNALVHPFNPVTTPQ
jgi:hypothetical protein